MASIEGWQARIIVVAVVMSALSTLVVALRVYIRTIWIRNFGLDDLFMCFGWFFTLSYAIEVLYIVVKDGLGDGIATLRPDQIVGILKVTLAIEFFYYGCVTFIKISILFFYLRIVASYFLLVACRATIWFIIAFFVVCTTVVFTQCIPLNKSWDITGTVTGHCVNTTVFFYITSGIHILLDIWIIVLPLRSLARIQRPSKEKIALFLIFGAGIFSLVSAIVRLYSIKLYTLSQDPTKDGIQVNLWSLLEVNVGILCASVPALKPLLSRPQLQRGTEVLNNDNGQDCEHSAKKDTKGSGRGEATQETIYMKSYSYSTAMRSISTGRKGGSTSHDDESTDDILPSAEPTYAGSRSESHDARTTELEPEHDLDSKL